MRSRSGRDLGRLALLVADHFRCGGGQESRRAGGQEGKLLMNWICNHKAEQPSCLTRALKHSSTQAGEEARSLQTVRYGTAKNHLTEKMHLHSMNMIQS